MKRRDKRGRYKRTREVWTPDNLDNGYYDADGRFRVYRPDYPGNTHPMGYIFRYRVVWWLETGKVVPKGFVLHHKNKIIDDDRFENLELMKFGEHSRLHATKNNQVEFICENCDKKFKVPKWRTKQRKTRFCSQECYHSKFKLSKEDIKSIRYFYEKGTMNQLELAKFYDVSKSVINLVINKKYGKILVKI